MANYRKLERVVKGFSNHRRIQMLQLVSDNPDLSLYEISGKLKINFKTASEHLRRLTVSGLISKRSEGSFVHHKISQRGRTILRFLKKLEYKIDEKELS